MPPANAEALVIKPFTRLNVRSRVSTSSATIRGELPAQVLEGLLKDYCPGQVRRRPEHARQEQLPAPDLVDIVIYLERAEALPRRRRRRRKAPPCRPSPSSPANSPPTARCKTSTEVPRRVRPRPLPKIETSMKRRTTRGSRLIDKAEPTSTPADAAQVDAAAMRKDTETPLDKRAADRSSSR